MTLCIAHSAFSARSRRAGAAALAASLFALGACDGPQPPQNLKAAEESYPSETWTFSVNIQPDRPLYTVTLEAESAEASDQVLIRGFEVRGAAGESLQIVRGLSAEPPRQALEAGAAFEVQDMNFDGYADFRILAFVPAGPNVGYLHWLYRPETDRFEDAPELDALSSPSFDSEARRVTASERASAAEYVDKTYEFSGDRLVLVHESVQKYSEPGSYRLTIRELVDGRMEVTDDRRVEEP